MSAEGNTLEKQAVLWILLGPFILLVTLIILLISPIHQSPLIPLISLLALPACWKWQIRGLSGTLACLAAISVYQFINSAPEIIFWELLLTVSAALTLSITAFCSLEVQELFKQHYLESLEISSRLQDFSGMKEKIQLANEKMQLQEKQKTREIDLALVKADELQQKLEAQSVVLQTCEDKFTSTQEKMGNVVTQNENLLRELFQKRHECDKLMRQLEANALEIKELKDLEELFNLQQQKSASQRQDFLDIDAKMQFMNKQIQLVEEQKIKEIELARAEADQLQQKLTVQSVLLQTREEAHSIALEKIESITTQNENLLRELFQKRHECDKFAHQLETCEIEITELKTEIALLAAGQPQSGEVVPQNDAELQLVSSASTSSASPNRAKGKPSKTNNWANAIMSRWSEPK